MTENLILVGKRTRGEEKGGGGTRKRERDETDVGEGGKKKTEEEDERGLPGGEESGRGQKERSGKGRVGLFYICLLGVRGPNCPMKTLWGLSVRPTIPLEADAFNECRPESGGGGWRESIKKQKSLCSCSPLACPLVRSQTCLFFLCCFQSLERICTLN